MVNQQNVKYALMLPPVSVAGGATATDSEVDTLGFDYATVVVQTGLVGANGIPTVKLQESDTSGSGETDIAGAALTALVDADGNKVYAIQLDLRKRKRYLSLVLTNGATNASLAAVLCILSRAEQAPNTAAKAGLGELKTI